MKSKSITKISNHEGPVRYVPEHGIEAIPRNIGFFAFALNETRRMPGKGILLFFTRTCKLEISPAIKHDKMQIE